MKEDCGIYVDAYNASSALCSSFKLMALGILAVGNFPLWSVGGPYVTPWVSGAVLKKRGSIHDWYEKLPFDNESDSKGTKRVSREMLNLDL